MAITMKDVRAWLDADEPDYAGAKQALGTAAVPFLLQLVQGGDLALASKATYLASMIQSAQSPAVVHAAAQSREAILRVAAASCIRNLPLVQAEKVLDSLKGDPDAGVRKVAVKSATRFTSARVAAKLELMAQSDPEPFVREQAISTVKEIRAKVR